MARPNRSGAKVERDWREKGGQVMKHMHVVTAMALPLWQDPSSRVVDPGTNRSSTRSVRSSIHKGKGYPSPWTPDASRRRNKREEEHSYSAAEREGRLRPKHGAGTAVPAQTN